MKALAIGLGIGVFASAFAVGFFLALARAAGRPRPKPSTGTLHYRMEVRIPRPLTSTDADDWADDMAGTPIFRAAVMREQERLRAELDDDAAVAAWLSGGAR